MTTTDQNQELFDAVRELRAGELSIDQFLKIVTTHQQAAIDKAVLAYCDKITTEGRPLPAEPLVVKMPVPCGDCGVEEYYDWTLLPHQVYNAVCPGGTQHLCLPCFAKRLLGFNEAIDKAVAEAQLAMLTWHENMKNTLIIDRSSSECGNCGRSANPTEEAHNTLLGYGADNGKPGCRCHWRYVTSNYAGMDERLREMRPDLEIIAPYPALAALTTPKERKE